jgi:hypothetical protein
MKINDSTYKPYFEDFLLMAKAWIYMNNLFTYFGLEVVK